VGGQDTSQIPLLWNREISFPDVDGRISGPSISEGWANRQLPRTEEYLVPGSTVTVLRGKQREVPLMWGDTSEIPQS